MKKIIEFIEDHKNFNIILEKQSQTLFYSVFDTIIENIKDFIESNNVEYTNCVNITHYYVNVKNLKWFLFTEFNRQSQLYGETIPAIIEIILMGIHHSIITWIDNQKCVINAYSKNALFDTEVTVIDSDELTLFLNDFMIRIYEEIYMAGGEEKND